MDNSGARRAISLILILVIIAVIIALLVSLWQNFFGNNNQPEEVNQGKASLLNTSEDRSVRMTVRGPLVADENYYTYTIKIGPTTRNMTTYNGYLNRQLEAVNLTNNLPAYEQFVYALDKANMMEAPQPGGAANETRGVCPAGALFTYETLRGTTPIKSLWTTSCQNTKGTLNTQQFPLRALFNAQIPNYTALLNNINLQY